ncbi:MAG: efflux RND transporter periplasmic adaptor subunit [Clostridiaceae bacterium]|nr:efflux RND transporter periplasmic adaptor subunit [Clostridiaceae bacterium]
MRKTQEDSVPVEMVTLVPNAVANRIICKGKLEYGVEYAVGVDKTVRVLTAAVEEGDYIGQGEKLMTLETENGVEIGTGIDVQGEILSVFSSFVNSSKAETDNGEPCIVAINDTGKQSLYSPAEGLVTKISVDTNGVVAAQNTLVMIADPMSLRIRAAVPEAYVQDLAVGMRCDITGEAFRDRVYAGEIVKIMPYAYQNTTLTGVGDTLVDVIVSIDEPDEALRSGYNAQVEIQTDLKENALLVPYEAVMQDENNVEYVFVEENGYAVRRDVKTGYELDDTIELVEGCAAGERVILNPGDLSENDRVRGESA